jgi:hypothetical protein
MVWEMEVICNQGFTAKQRSSGQSEITALLLK